MVHLTNWSSVLSYLPEGLKNVLRRARNVFLHKQDIATLKDVYYCYRLFLHRKPDPEGWRTWRDHILRYQPSIQSLTQAFLSSDEFHLLREKEESPQLVSFPGFKIFVDVRDPAVGAILAKSSEYEPGVSREFRRHCLSGAYVLDIGANIGYFSLLAASLVGTSGQVIAFEPNPKNCDLLSKSMEVSGFINISIRQQAVSNQSGVLTLSVAAGGSNGRIITTEHLPETHNQYKVTCVAIDSVLTDLQSLDLVKIDIEGAEPLAIQGMVETLQRFKPAILSEFSPKYLSETCGWSGAGYLDLLRNIGYDIYMIKDSGNSKSLANQEILDFFSSSGQSHIDLLCLWK